MNMDDGLLPSLLLVFRHPLHLCEQRVVSTHAYIGPGMNERPELSHKDAPRPHVLPVKDLDASPLARAVSSVS